MAGEPPAIAAREKERAASGRDDEASTIRGLDVSITTTAQTDEQALALLRGLGLPFAQPEGDN